jgi:hypothetical protein
MEVTRRPAYRDSAGPVCAHATRRMVSVAWTMLRLTLYSVLALLEPLVIWGAAALTITCLALCLLFRVIVHAPHFPTGFALLLAAGSALALVAYYALMAILLPE